MSANADHSHAQVSVPPTRITPIHGRAGSAPTVPARRMRIGEALVAAGIITNTQLAECLTAQAAQPASSRRRLGDVAVSLGFVTQAHVAQALATAFGFEYVDLSVTPVDPAVARAVPKELAYRLDVVPLETGGTWIKVAVADPTDRTGIDQLRRATRLPSVSLAVAPRDQIAAVLDQVWSPAHDPAPVPLVAPSATTDAPRPVSPPSKPMDDERAPVAPVAPGAAPAPAVPAAAPASAGVASTATGDGWEYTLIGDALPMSHPGYTDGLGALQGRLGVLGREGWEAVGLHSNGNRMALLMKRALGG